MKNHIDTEKQLRSDPKKFILGQIVKNQLHPKINQLGQILKNQLRAELKNSSQGRSQKINYPPPPLFLPFPAKSVKQKHEACFNK